MRCACRLVLVALMGVATMAGFASPAAGQGSETEPLTLAPQELQILTEPATTPCPAVSPSSPPASGNFATSGGCLVHVVATGLTFSWHFLGFEAVDQCNLEVDMRIASNGTGYLTHQELVPTLGMGACGRRPCHYPNTPTPSFETPSTTNGTHNEARPWRFYAREGATAPRETITILFCFEFRHTLALEPPGSGLTAKRHCNITVPFAATTQHRYAFTANDVTGSTSPATDIRCELNGTLSTESSVSVGSEGSRAQIDVRHL